MSIITKGFVDGTFIVARGYCGTVLDYLIKHSSNSHIIMRLNRISYIWKDEQQYSHVIDFNGIKIVDILDNKIVTKQIEFVYYINSTIHSTLSFDSYI